MKHLGRWSVLALCCALLSGCAAQAGIPPQLPGGPSVQTTWSVLEGQEPLPAVGERWYQDYVPSLLPREDYGPLVSFRGALGMTLAWWEEEPAYTSPTWFYGLMTRDGTLVMDAVCTSISRPGYPLWDPDTGGQTTRFLPVYALTRGDAAMGRPATGELIALAAEDGSWSTDYQYWGVIPYPEGIAAGNREGLALVDIQTGRETGRRTWSELGIDDPAAIPWFTGDASGAVQWTGKNLFLGTLGENWETAYFLDPATWNVTTCPASDWYTWWDDWYNSPAYNSSLWISQSNGDGTITLTRGGERHTFASPLPQDEYPSVVGNDRVYFLTWVGEVNTFAVTDLDGKVLIPVQDGTLTVLSGSPQSDLLLFAILGPEGWDIYDRDGEKRYTLPGRTGSWCYLSDDLVEIVQENCVSYYQPQTGTCIRRTYAGLPG